MTVEDYLDLISEWNDPNPIPIIELIDGIHVVRDDYLQYGSKIRFLDFLVSTIKEKEIVFGEATAQGYAQISLTHLCRTYGKTCTIFMAKRSLSNLHPYQKIALEMGCNMKFVKMGMLAVTKKRALDYYLENPTDRFLLPIGLEHPTSIASIIKVARNLPIEPESIWVAASSGTLARGLAMAFPNAQVNGVSVVHTMSDEQKGRCIIWKSPYSFVMKANIDPSKNTLFWNVGHDEKFNRT